MFGRVTRITLVTNGMSPAILPRYMPRERDVAEQERLEEQQPDAEAGDGGDLVAHDRPHSHPDRGEQIWVGIPHDRRGRSSDDRRGVRDSLGPRNALDRDR